MKYVKMLGLAAVAAMALMAFVGAGTASATTLFKAGGTALVAGDEIVSTVEGSASLADTNGNPIVTCSASTVSGKIANAGGASATVSGSVEAKNLSFSSCTSTVTSVEGGELEIHNIAGTTNGTLTAKGFDVVIHVFGVECGYTAGTGTDLGTLTGSTTTNATMDINAIVTRKTGGFLCPSTARWIANYKVTTPSVLYVD